MIAATNRDLKKAMERGDFREDLYYRLQVFDIPLTPLRERPEDILPLSEAFLEEIGQSFGRPPAGLTREAKDALLQHEWRGNVRELRNTLERAAILCEGGLIAAQHLSLRATERPAGAATTDLRIVERETIETVLRETGGNKVKAAKRLGLSRTQLYVRLRKYGARRPTGRTRKPHKGQAVTVSKDGRSRFQRTRRARCEAFDAAPSERFRRPSFGAFLTLPFERSRRCPLDRSSALFPAAAERPVDLNESEEFVELRVGEAELGREQAAVAVQHFEVARGAALVPQIGQPPRIARGSGEQFLLLTKVPALPVGDERVRDVAQRLLNRLLVDERGLFALCRGQLHAGAGSARR